MNWIDYSTDTVYSFGKSFFFPLDGSYIFSFSQIFFSFENINTLTTKEFLKTYEDQLAGVDDIIASYEEDYDRDFDSLSEECKADMEEIRLSFREETKLLEDWPLSQLVFSIFYRQLIKVCCPYQDMFWKTLFLNSLINKNTEKAKDVLEGASAENISDLDKSLLADKLVFLDSFYLKETDLEEAKKIRNTSTYFWYLPLRSIFLGDTNKKLSLEILDLFLAFVNRHSGFTREFPALRDTLLQLLKLYNFRDDAKQENRVFYSLILIPLFDLLGISFVETRLAFINYIETKDREILINLLSKIKEKEPIKDNNMIETNK